jgi:hypothetical protein
MQSNLLIFKALSAFQHNAYYYLYYLIEGGRQFKPTNQFSSFSLKTQTAKPVQQFQLANPNENPNFNQVVPVFVQMMAGKPYKHCIVSVPLKNIDIHYGLMLRDFGELETRKWPPGLGEWGVCVRSRLTKIF